MAQEFSKMSLVGGEFDGKWKGNRTSVVKIPRSYSLINS